MRIAKPWSLPTEPATKAILSAAGVTDGMIGTALRNGALVRLRHGVYLANSAAPTDPIGQHLILARAEVVANPNAVISHQSAALALGLPYPGFGEWHDFPASVTLPAGGGFRGSRQGATHHVAALPTEHLARDPHGYPVTSLARTAIDLASSLDLPEALVLLDAAARGLCAGFVAQPRRRDYADPVLAEAARALLTETARANHRPGMAAAIALANPARESVAESLSAGYFQLAGIATPVFQAAVRTASGRFFPDCLWTEQRLIGECDGAVKYRDAEAFVHEKEREQALRDAGYAMVRWLAKEIMTTPSIVVARVARALDC